jgi:gamma-glutamylcyclotransferase (GGCT)/AIG2-like uncharacterized protein YtfP
MEIAAHMQHTPEYLPVFVYGTLRAGQNNWRRYLAGKTLAAYPAIAPKHKMFSTNYAYVTDAPDYQVIGELMLIRPECYAPVMQDLDRLEDYDPDDLEGSLYVRVQREVLVIESVPRPHRAWIYHLNPRRRGTFSEADLVPHGDWLRHGRGERR